MGVRQSDIEPNVPLPMPPGLICFWKKTRATIPSGWGLCDGLWYDPLDMTPGQVGQAATDAEHTVQTDDLIDKFIAGAGNLYAQGATGGAAAVTLTAAEMPVHKHDVSATTGANGAHTHNVDAYTTGTGIAKPLKTGDAGTSGASANAARSAGDHTHAVTVTESNKGSGDAHANLPPYRAEYPIEKL